MSGSIQRCYKMYINVIACINRTLHYWLNSVHALISAGCWSRSITPSQYCIALGRQRQNVMWSRLGVKMQGQFIKCKHMHEGTPTPLSVLSKVFIRLSKPLVHHRDVWLGDKSWGAAVFLQGKLLRRRYDRISALFIKTAPRKRFTQWLFSAGFLRLVVQALVPWLDFQSSAYFLRACWKGREAEK